MIYIFQCPNCKKIFVGKYVNTLNGEHSVGCIVPLEEIARIDLGSIQSA